MTKKKAIKVKHLGKKTDYKYSGADASLLDTFKSPFQNRVSVSALIRKRGTVHIEAPEFTSLCPLTGQPDFATIVIDYMPAELCVESKALKLYLGSFRMHGEFHESCVNRIAEDLHRLLKPFWLKVEGRFTPRGGIPFWPIVEIGYL